MENLSEYYLSEISRIIAQNFKSDDVSGSMSAATVGNLARKVLVRKPNAFGFPKFSDALKVLEVRGMIRVGANSKGLLGIWYSPEGPTLFDPSAKKGAESPTSLLRFRPLRQQVWRAFVAALPVGRRFVDRKTGEIRMGQENAPLDGDWVEIAPLNVERAKEDARKFLEQENVPWTEDLAKALDSSRWFLEFTEELKKINPALAPKWNRNRSHQVGAEVEEWRKKNNVPESLVYAPPEFRKESGTVVSGTTNLNDELRASLLRALASMTTDELVNLPIPPKYLIGAIRPDLLGKPQTS